MADEFDNAFHRLDQQRALTALSVSRPAPDVVGRANVIARETGVPADTADRNLPALEQQVQMARARAVMDASPTVATWAAKPRNAAVGADDMDQLAKNAAYWQQVGRASGSIISTPLPAPTLWSGIKGVAASLYQGVASAGAEVRGVLGDWLPTPPSLAAPGTPRLGGSMMENDRRTRAQANARIADATPEFKSWYARGLYGGASSLAQMAPSVALGTLAGSPALGIATAAVQTGVPAYNKYRDRGASRGQAALGGTLEGGAEALGEALPMGFLVDSIGGKLGKKGVGEFLAGYLGRELPSEMATTLAQNAVDTAIANPDKTWGQYLSEQPDALVQTAIGTLMAAGTFAGVHQAAQRYGVQADEQGRAAASAGALDTAMAGAAESKTRQRDPEAFKELVGLHTHDTPIEQIFVPADSLSRYFQSQEIDPSTDNFWSKYASQIQEAMATGGDVVVPTADAAAYLAGTPAWDAIRADVRTSPGGMSQSEAEAWGAAHTENMERLGADVAEQIATARTADAPRQRLYQSMREKLTAAGLTDDAAHINAELVAQRYATRAQRLGQDLTGDETNHIAVNAVLPGKLAPIVASDPERVALKSVINTMRSARGGKVQRGPSLVEWISSQGGVEDRGGDIASMGGADWHRGKPGKRKLIRPHDDVDQGSMLGGTGRQNANTPDDLAMRAQEAGYLPEGERPTVNDLFDAIGEELRGSPRYTEDGAPQVSRDREAADELAQLLDQAGLDPAKATETEIVKAIDAYRAAQEGGYRQDGVTPRGQITFQDGRTVIDLFQARNASTFAHEMGHQWLEETRDDAGQSDQLTADWQTVTDWFAANGHPVDEDGSIPVEAHELWARGVERFLMEGKSPTSALRKAFESFRSWLLNIYQVVDNLRSPITPEIRNVMQRLVATDEEISDATEREHLSSLFTDAIQAGMTEAEFSAYQAAASEARDAAHDALLYRTMAAIRRERTVAWQDERKAVRAETARKVNRRPEFRALHLLRTGRMLDNPAAPVMTARLDKAWLVAEYGEGILASLPKGVPPIYSETNTMAADDIAEMVGFRTGDEMVRTLTAIEDRTRELRDAGDKRSVRDVLIDEETAAEMTERHGDILNDGSIEQEALAAVHNDRQGDVIASELRALGRRTNQQAAPYEIAKEWARSKILESTVQESTSGAAIQRYARAAAKAGRAAEVAMLNRDIDETFRHKQTQMLNNALVAEAGRMREEVIAARDRLAAFAKRRTIKSMDQEYLERIHDLLEQVEFRPRSQSSIDRQGSFEEWAQSREAEGHDVVVPISFARSLGTTHWSRLTVEKMIGLDETVAQIAHLGRFKQRLLDDQEEREFNVVVDEAVAAAERLPQRAPSDLMEPDWRERFASGVASVDASLLKMETVFDWLDGGNSNGVFNRVVFEPISRAQTRESDMLADYYGRIRSVMEEVPKETLARWQDRVLVPELYNRETGRPFDFARQQLVAIALNMGNAGNIQRLTDGYNWNQSRVMEALNRELSEPEWRFVQKVWDVVETLWPEIKAMERRVNGVEPDKVTPVPLETSAGRLNGGYFPAIYDSRRNLKAEANAGKASDLLETTYTKATTRSSATKERENQVKRPILLQLGVINRHIGEVIHDITHREVIMNADKFLSSERIGRAINASLGPEIRQQFRPWLKSVANQWANDRGGLEGFAGFVSKARANTTAVGMGFRISTIITQVGGYSNSFEKVGVKWVSAALAQTARHPIETYRFVTERSGEIRHRMDTLDRDINAGIKSLAGQHDLAADAKRFMYHGIGYTDRMVVVPTWVGAYNKALAAGMLEDAAVYEADKAVRQTQGSGGAKDLAAIQRGSGTMGALAKLTTMFYSYMSAFYQRTRTYGRDAGAAISERDARALPGLMARAWWLFVVPPVLNELLAGRGPDDDEDWGTWTFKQMLFQILGPIPIVRDLAKPIWEKAAGDRTFGYQISPMQRAGDMMVNFAGDVGTKARGEETKQMTRNTLEAAGYATGVVPGQVAAAAQFLVDVGQGEQDPEGLGEWYRGLTTGHAKQRATN